MLQVSAMFDWEDEEITSIIWGKEGENEDHIVHCPAETYGQNSKVSDQEAANVKITRKTTESKNITDLGQGKNTQYYTHGRASADGFGTQLDLSSSKATKLAHEYTAQVDNGSQIFDIEAEDKDGGNFVDYGWANVGSFDDLDRIISNHDLELWSSTKDVIGCPENPELLSIDSPNLYLGVLKSNRHHLGTKSGVVKNENTHKKRARIKKEREGQYTQQSKVSSLRIVRNQETESFGYTHFIGAFPSPRGYNMMINQHSGGSASSHQQVSSASSYISGKTRDTPLSMTPQEKIEKLRRHQQICALLAIRKQQQEIRQQDDYSNLELCSQESHTQFQIPGRVELDQSLSNLISLDPSSPLEQSNSDAKSVMMDKTALADNLLHQFQNVIAGLGIQMRLCIRDSLLRLAQGALQRKNDDTTNKISNDGLTVVMEGVSSTKRDSLLRLAQGALQRKNDDTTNKISNDGLTVVMEGVNSTKSSARTRDGETKTNPIDRVVARLLFHTPPWELVQSLSGASEATTTATMKFHSYLAAENKTNGC